MEVDRAAPGFEYEQTSQETNILYSALRRDRKSPVFRITGAAMPKALAVPVEGLFCSYKHTPKCLPNTE